MLIFVITIPSQFEYGVYDKKYFLSYENAQNFLKAHHFYNSIITTIRTED